jgi:predicted ester cyclase
MKTSITCLFFFCCTFVFAQEDKEVTSQVEKFRLALIDPTEANLTKISSADLSYGHSSGKLENQSQFIETLVSGASDFAAVSFENQTIQVEKDVAIVRHTFSADVVDAGKSTAIKIGILLVWQKEKNDWKLLARQAFKLP